MSGLTETDQDTILLSMPEDVWAARNVKPLFDAVEHIVAEQVAAAELALLEQIADDLAQRRDENRRNEKGRRASRAYRAGLGAAEIAVREAIAERDPLAGVREMQSRAEAWNLDQPGPTAGPDCWPGFDR